MKKAALIAMCASTVLASVTPVATASPSLGSIDALSSHNAVGSADVLSSQKPLPRPTTTKEKQIARAVGEHNKRYSANNNSGEGKTDSVHWVDRTKESKIVIIAPHATNHHRDGRPKKADAFTGGMAEVLSDRLHASVLTTTGEVSDWGDKWAGRDDQFTRILHSLPKDSIILDLHGMENSSSKGDISIGTGAKEPVGAKKLAKNIRTAFDGATIIDGKFKAEDSYTDTDHMQRRGYSIIQVEASENFRDPKENRVGHTILALENALRKTAQQLGKKTQ